MSNLRLIKKKKKKRNIKWGEHEGENGKKAQELLLEIVNNQIRDNDPPETVLTLQRLIKEGFSEVDSKKLIAAIVAKEIFGMTKHRGEYDQERYINALHSLPDSASE